MRRAEKRAVMHAAKCRGRSPKCKTQKEMQGGAAMRARKSARTAAKEEASRQPPLEAQSQRAHAKMLAATHEDR